MDFMTQFVPECIIKGEIVVAADYEKYEGSYDVIPSENPQTLLTKYRVMSDDVHVRAIPIYRVANVFGGDTFTIGELNG